MRPAAPSASLQGSTRARRPPGRSPGPCAVWARSHWRAAPVGVLVHSPHLPQEHRDDVRPSTCGSGQVCGAGVQGRRSWCPSRAAAPRRAGSSCRRWRPCPPFWVGSPGHASGARQHANRREVTGPSPHPVQATSSEPGLSSILAGFPGWWRPACRQSSLPKDRI